MAINTSILESNDEGDKRAHPTSLFIVEVGPDYERLNQNEEQVYHDGNFAAKSIHNASNHPSPYYLPDS